MHFFLNNLHLVTIKTGTSLAQLWLYVIAGVLVGEYLRYTSWMKLVERACLARPLLAIMLASLLGTLSPLCTYGTVPVVAEMVAAGVAIAPVVAFLSASSLMNPQLFVLTWGGISPEMALARTISVLLFAVVLGLFLARLPQSWFINPGILKTFPDAKKYRVRTFAWRDYSTRCLKTLRFIGGYLLFGVVLGAVIEVFAPAHLFQQLLGGKFTGLLVAVAVSIPLSACGGAAIPLVGSLMRQGMTQGSALAFFIAGPAARPTPLMALATVLRLRALVLYVVVLAVFSVLAGGLYSG